MTDKQWEVRTPTGRRLFAGLEEDARKYVEDNFPRLHNEPGNDYGDEGPKPDVTLYSPDGAESSLRSNDGWTDADKKSEKSDKPKVPAKKSLAEKAVV